MQDRLREIFGRLVPGKEKLPPHVSRDPEHGLVFTKEDRHSLTLNQISKPGGGSLKFDSTAKHQSEYLRELHTQFPDYFPQVYGLTADKRGYQMEYLPGPSLSEYIQAGGKVPSQLLEAIYHARDEIHEAGFAHGDLKQDNTILKLNDDGKIAGFKFIDPVPPVLRDAGQNYSRPELLGMLREADIGKMADWTTE